MNRPLVPWLLVLLLLMTNLFLAVRLLEAQLLLSKARVLLEEGVGIMQRMEERCQWNIQ